MKKGFTLIELIFVIVIIGILSAVAVPKFTASKVNAEIKATKAIVQNVRGAILDLHSNKLMEGKNYYPQTLDEAQVNSSDEALFEGNTTKGETLLEYPIYSKDDPKGGWMKTGDTNYSVNIEGVKVKFNYYKNNGHFDCKNINSDESDDMCKSITH